MCFPGNEHPDFDASWQTLKSHWSVSGHQIRSLIGKAVLAVDSAQKLKRPHGLISRNAHSASGTSATLHYAVKSSLSAVAICIADDRRDGADYCLNFLLVDGTALLGSWIVHDDPFEAGADLAI